MAEDTNPTHTPRRLIWIEGAQTDCHQAALQLLVHTSASKTGWIGTHPPPNGITAQPLGKARALLGRTLFAGVLDAHDGLDPDDLGALAGTVQGGGHCLLLTPPAEEWQSAPDPAMAPLLSHGLSLADCHGYFIQRLCQLLSGSDTVERLAADTPINTPLPVPGIQTPGDTTTPTDDQSKVIAAITRQFSSNDQSRLLITADRGRGKSAALGMAIRALAPAPVRLTSPSRAAASSVFAHAAPAAPIFLAPERVTADSTLLMIDEAAALPLGQLEAIIEENPRCILTSTVHGYEGSGQGLMLRLAKKLSEAPGHFQPLHLQQPVRWAADDPLEALINQILLLDAEPPALGAPASGSSPIIEPVTAASLARQPSMLRECFALLISGHYRTRPRDLRQLLDDPHMQIWRMREPTGISSAILVARPEGGLDAKITAAIHRGQRRPPGHLIAQSMTFHAGIPTAARLRGLRIQRIAVHPARHRLGYGTQLVTEAIDAAQQQRLDWIGTSFGYAPELLDFWLACGFLPARYGYRRDPRSGAQAVIMLKPLSTDGEKLLAMAQAQLNEHSSNQPGR